MYFSIGSSSPRRPSSHSIITADDVMSLVLENARNRWSGRSATPFSTSANPAQWTSTTSRPTRTAVDTPDRIDEST